MSDKAIYIKAEVTHVADGDSISVRYTEELAQSVKEDFRVILEPSCFDDLRVRLFGIDAPELSQGDIGQNAKLRLRKLLNPYKYVTLAIRDIDFYDRIVAEIWVEGCSINLQLVVEGHALCLAHRLEGEHKDNYLAAQELAQKYRLNFWKTQNCPPWEHRMLNPRQ